jgi:4'-phosphopantetheinyl transferase
MMWLSPPNLLSWKEQHLDIWWIDVQAYTDHLADFAPLLSSMELKQAERFFHLQDRQYYTVTHGICRLILSRYVNQPAQQIRIVPASHGKPLLASSTDIHFNLTHSGSKALVAIGRYPLGIDMEQMKADLPFDELVSQFMSPQEEKSFATLPPQQKREAFYLCWTRKEAYVKAIGQGLFYPIRQVTFSFDPADVRFTDEANPSFSQEWTLYQLPTVGSYTQVVVSQQSEASLRLFTFSL